MRGFQPTDLDGELPRLITPERLAREWSLREETVRRWCREGRLPGVVNIGFGTKPLWRIDVKELDEWLQGRKERGK